MEIKPIDELMTKMTISHQSLMKIKDDEQQFSVSELRLIRKSLQELLLAVINADKTLEDEMFKVISTDIATLNQKIELDRQMRFNSNEFVSQSISN